MRKRLKRKRRSCALCKPQKTGHASRWTPEDAVRLKEAERDIAESLKTIT